MTTSVLSRLRGSNKDFSWKGLLNIALCCGKLQWVQSYAEERLSSNVDSLLSPVCVILSRAAII